MSGLEALPRPCLNCGRLAGDHASRPGRGVFCSGDSGPRYQPKPAPETLVIVGCSARKLDRRAPARDLYSPSRLFRAARAYAEALERAHGWPWVVISAGFGLAHPERELDPYDRRLDALGADDQRQVRAWLTADLARWHRLGTRRAVVLAGRAYVEALPAWLAREEPLRGLGVGARYSRLVELTAALGDA